MDNISIILAPYSSILTTVTANYFKNKDKKIPILAGYAASKDVFQCNEGPYYQEGCNESTVGERIYPYLWGIKPSADKSYGEYFNTLKLLLQNHITFAGFTSSDPFPVSLLNGCTDYARTFGMEVVLSTTIPNLSIDAANRIALVQEFKKKRPDIIFAGFSLQNNTECIEFMRELKAQDYVPKVLLLVRCVEESIYYKNPDTEIFIYSHDIYSFDRNNADSISYNDIPGSPYRVQVGSNKTASKSWFEDFSRFYEPPDSHYAPSAYCTAKMVEYVIKLAQSTDPVALQKAYKQEQLFVGE